MANLEHLDILKRGVDVWNEWREEHPEIEPDLTGENFIEVPRLEGVNFSGVNLMDVRLFGRNLTGANLTNSYLHRAVIVQTGLSHADLTRAGLLATTLVNVDLRYATIKDCRVFGISIWNVMLEGAIQSELNICDDYEYPIITVDDLEVAQFIYVLKNNQKVRKVIDTITSKAVLILGRFVPERKAVLNSLKDELGKHNYLPIVVDFEKPANRDITETVSTLAHMARFVIADITDAKSIPQELMLIVPNLPSVPVQPLILNSKHEYGMFEHFTRFPWVLPIYRYKDEASLLQSLKENVIDPAEEKAKELAKQ